MEILTTTGLFIQSNIWLQGLLVLWTLVWKGIALWHAAQLKHKKWFIALLVLNFVGLLSIFYIFFVVKKAKDKMAGGQSSY